MKDFMLYPHKKNCYAAGVFNDEIDKEDIISKVTIEDMEFYSCEALNHLNGRRHLESINKSVRTVDTSCSYLYQLNLLDKLSKK